MSTDLQKGEAYVSLQYLNSISVDAIFLSVDISCRIKRLSGGGHLTSNDDDDDELPALISLDDCGVCCRHTHQRPVRAKL
ncbi:hypothetical protein B0H16DRAFT_1724550 [Mycena metata]|uniref:Uncharacterized protein n=1 Tax=Mycena metata TaxID=1033252 RepID=A0AAD7HVG9_9AGAR|nr:hypothetical protein B0H16DRAFT_1734831 [Mycena metata]KAJ7750619.1 hypothetical protein B0H16DRAFT_1724550 [Mycena metata]